MVFGAKINENYESDAKELEKVVVAGILLCRTFFLLPKQSFTEEGVFLDKNMRSLKLLTEITYS